MSRRRYCWVGEMVQRSLAEKFEFVPRRMAELGLPLHPSSRLVRARRLFDSRPAERSTIYSNEPEFLDACEAMRDYQIYDIVLQHACLFAGDRVAYERLADSRNDDLVPHLRKNTPGRDAQAELFMATGMHRAWQDVRFQAARNDQEWPDLRARIGGGYFFVDVKRSKSSSTIVKNVAKGVSQVEETGCPGAVAVDVSFAFNPDRAPETRKLTDEEFQKLNGDELRRSIRQFERELFRELQGSRVGGIVFQNHVIRRTSETTNGLESCAIMFDNPAARAPDRDLWLQFKGTLDHAWRTV